MAMMVYVGITIFLLLLLFFFHRGASSTSSATNNKIANHHQQQLLVIASGHCLFLLVSSTMVTQHTLLLVDSEPTGCDGQNSVGGRPSSRLVHDDNRSSQKSRRRGVDLKNLLHRRHR